MGPVTVPALVAIVDVLWQVIPEEQKDTALRMARAFFDRLVNGEPLDQVLRDPVIWAEFPQLEADRIELLALAITGAMATPAGPTGPDGM